MAHISYYYKEDERIEDIRSLLLHVNPLNKDVKCDDTYFDFAQCLHYLYVHTEKKKFKEFTPLFINELFNSVSNKNKATLSSVLTSMFCLWKMEEDDPKRYHNLEHFKPYVWIKNHLYYFKGLGLGSLFMFLLMLEIALKMK